MIKKHSESLYDRPHRSWHVLGAVAVLLLGMAAVLYLKPVNSHLDQAQQHLLVILCIIAGVACVVPWLLRRVLSRDWRMTLTRHAHRPAPPADAMPPVVFPRWLQTGLWFILALWMMWVAWTLTIDDRLAASLTLENGLLQDITVLCYIAGALLLFRLALGALSPRAEPGLGRWWLLTLALGCVGVAGEEINWGQSVLPYETPEFLARTNIQQEVSFHNVELPGLPGRHWSNDVLWGISLVGGAVLPLSLLLSAPIRRLTRVTEIPLPPWVSQSYFLAAALIPRDGDMLGRLSRDNIPSELREVTMGFAMLIWAWTLWRQQTATPADREDHTRRDAELDETRIQQA